MLVVVVVVGVCVAVASGCISVCRRSDSHCQDEGVVVVLFSNVWVGCGLPYIVCMHIYYMGCPTELACWYLLVRILSLVAVCCVGLFVFAAVSAITIVNLCVYLYIIGGFAHLVVCGG